MIYFIQDSDTLHVKIGHTRGDPAARLKDLQTGNPSKLVLLGTMPGGQAEEAGLHQRFAAARAAGEWFRPVPELLLLIGRACHDGPPFDAAAGPPGDGVRFYLSAKVEGVAAQRLLRLLREHGPDAFSRRGPLGEAADPLVKDIIRDAAAYGGFEAMRRVYAFVVDRATELYGCRAGGLAGAALDHRFDSVGGWHA